MKPQDNFFDDVTMNEPQGDFFAEAANTQTTYSVEDAANAGNIDAIQELMMTYFNQMDYNNAKMWAKKGAANNDALCLHILGEIARIGKKYDESIQWFQRNVQINSFAKSASELGCILMNFEDDPKCPKDTFRAKGLFEFALQDDNTDGDAWFGLAVAHMDDTDAKDFSIIKQCFQNAYKYGSPEIKNVTQALLKQIQETEQQQTNNSGSCYITTAVCGSFGQPDDCYELSMFREFRDSWLRQQEDGEDIISEYYATAPLIVSAIDRLSEAKEIYRSIWDKYLSSCLAHIENHEYAQCKVLYMRMVRELQARFLA